MNTNGNLTSTEKVALSKLLPYQSKNYKNARAEIGNGVEYDVDFTVRVRGQLKVGEKYNATATFQLSLYNVLAYLSQEFTERNQQDILEAAVNAASLQYKKRIPKKLQKDAEKFKKQLQARLEQMLPKEPCNGKVNSELLVEKITTPSAKRGLEKAAPIKERKAA